MAEAGESTPGGCGGKCSVCLSHPKCAACKSVIESIRHKDIRLENVSVDDIHACYKCGVIVCATCKPANQDLDRFMFANGLCPRCDSELQKKVTGAT